ncbi:hypothetical protein Pmani_014810 [Petrolisthes manimaculis]|uniref:BZIP domain-containing protein n=1 Tax=Petrolisthes manimaculis TaxID=1843537 RepID=A0AAE1U8B8_9EUCA|nr:hypothetical protein Pmani_014810 [Petrolisthes manimaculis]
MSGSSCEDNLPELVDGGGLKDNVSGSYDCGLSGDVMGTGQKEVASFSGGDVQPQRQPKKKVGRNERSMRSVAALTPTRQPSSHTANHPAPAPRKRQPKVNHASLTEEQRSQRIKGINKVSAQTYREKEKNELLRLQQREDRLNIQNQKLQRKATGLQQLRDEMEMFTHTFFKEHMGSSMGSSGAVLPHISH